jgi:hypothetical protein
MSERVLVVERAKRAGERALPYGTEVLDTPDRVRDAARERRALWVAPRAADLALLGELARQVVELKGDHRLVIRDRVGRGRIEVLRVLFRYVISADEQLRLLPTDELIEVVSSPQRHDLFVGVAIDREDDSLVFYRGSLEPIVVPASFLAPGVAGALDLSELEVIDFGQAVRFGKREAATDAILYAFDPDYRRRQKAQLVEQDDSFGGSLRRLRLIKGLSRNDFEGISPKEIARIERGEVQRPHPRTVKLLARHLGVEPDEVVSY